MNQSELTDLFTAVHDQNATEEETQKLDQWLRDNPDRQRQYIDFIDTMQEIEHRVGKLTQSDVHKSSLHTKPAFLVTEWLRSSRFIHIALAASLLAILGTAFWIVNTTPDALVASAGHEPRVQGIVTASENGEAHFGDRVLQPGSAFGSGLLKLNLGKIKIRLESGVELSLAAPAEIDVLDSQQIELLSGAITADVPDAVIGFTMKMPGLNVVDLGTKFGVNLPLGGQPQVHVFDGVVDAEVKGSNKQTVRLTDKQTILFDGKQVAKTDFDAALFVQPSERLRSDPVTSGDVRFLHTPPKSVELGEFEHDLILCFRELGKSIEVAEDLVVSIDDPGHYHVYPRWQDLGEIRSGTKVNSYFVHLDSISTEKQPRHGSLTFDRPILGVVFSRKLLTEYDKVFGDPRTVYASDRPNAKLPTTLENESVTLSADRRTISFRWFIRQLSDQVRILVAAEGE
jgi:ferric-dicitrate binding protein FerR (iron transport regulator)